MLNSQQGLQVLNVGRDPRMLPEFEALRSEINKISHAAHPTVDWERIHQLAGRIFEQYGVDLQTATYFTLARARLQGLSGFTEGCELLANVIVTQWEHVWPPVIQERARIDILDWFIARVSGVIRQYFLSFDDKPLLHRCAQALQLINDKLLCVGLSRVPRVENLIHFIDDCTRQLDEPCLVDGSLSCVDIDTVQEVPAHHVVVALPPSTPSTPSTPNIPSSSPSDAPTTLERPTVAEFAPQTKPRKSAWSWFAAGVLACGVPMAAIGGWQWHDARQQEAISWLQQPADNWPTALDYGEIRHVRSVLGESALQGMEGDMIVRYQAQLTRLGLRSPLAEYQHGDELLSSLQMLYPDSPWVKVAARHWQALLAREATGGESGYQAARDGVDALLAELNALESEHKTVTISYLKGQLYEIQKNQMLDVPFAERLMVLEAKKRMQTPLGIGELEGMETELKRFAIRLHGLNAKDKVAVE